MNDKHLHPSGRTRRGDLRIDTFLHSLRGVLQISLPTSHLFSFSQVFRLYVGAVIEQSITSENIMQLVRIFYPTILSDEIVAPFFIEKLGDDISSKIWQEHLVLLGSFWASVALGDSAYQGNPLAPHFQMEGISREAFERWLALFSAAVDSVYRAQAGEFFKVRSEVIAGNFMRNLDL